MSINVMGRMLAMLALLPAFASAHAQVAPPGARVRVAQTRGGTPAEGSLVIMTADSLTLRPGVSDVMLTMPMDSVRTVDVSDGMHSRFGVTMRYGAVGMAAGLVVALFVFKGSCAHEGNGGERACDLGYGIVGVPIGLVGFVGGALVGHSRKSERWTRVYDRERAMTLRIGPSPRGGLNVGMTIPFGASLAHRSAQRSLDGTQP